MTIRVSKLEAEQQISQLLKKVLQGEEIAISLEGKEIARLVPVARKNVTSADKQSRIPGIDAGRFVVPDDFDDPLPSEILQAFNGEE